jgi:hypothetical protein
LNRLPAKPRCVCVHSYVSTAASLALLLNTTVAPTAVWQQIEERNLFEPVASSRVGHRRRELKERFPEIRVARAGWRISDGQRSIAL